KTHVAQGDSTLFSARRLLAGALRFFSWVCPFLRRHCLLMRSTPESLPSATFLSRFHQLPPELLPFNAMLRRFPRSYKHYRNVPRPNRLMKNCSRFSTFLGGKSALRT